MDIEVKIDPSCDSLRFIEFTLKIRLYECESKLNSNLFVRLSNSEIINLKEGSNLDLNYTGTIQVVVSLAYGMIWGVSPLVFQIEKWSLLSQTITHLLMTSLFSFSTAYLCF